MFKDDKMISILSAVIVMVAIGTILQKANSLPDFLTFGSDANTEIALVDDDVVVQGNMLQRIDVFANDVAIGDADRQSLRIVDHPECGRVFVQGDVMQYLADANCRGTQRITYTVDSLDGLMLATVTAQVLGAGETTAAARPDATASSETQVAAAPAVAEATAPTQDAGIAGTAPPAIPADDRVAGRLPDLGVPQVPQVEVGPQPAASDATAATQDERSSLVGTLTNGAAQPAAAAVEITPPPAIAPGQADRLAAAPVLPRTPAQDVAPAAPAQDVAPPAPAQDVAPAAPSTSAAVSDSAREPVQPQPAGADSAPRIIVPSGIRPAAGSAETLAAPPAIAGVTDGSDLKPVGQGTPQIEAAPGPGALAALGTVPSDARPAASEREVRAPVPVVRRGPSAPVTREAGIEPPGVGGAAADTPAIAPAPPAADPAGAEPPLGLTFNTDQLLGVRGGAVPPVAAPAAPVAPLAGDAAAAPGSLRSGSAEETAFVVAVAPEASELSTLTDLGGALRVLPADPEGPPPAPEPPAADSSTPTDRPAAAGDEGGTEKIAALPRADSTCALAPAMTLDIRRAAQTLISVTAPCHRGTVAELAYSGIRIAVPLDGTGKGDIVALGFEANAPALLVFANGEKIDFDLPFRDIDRISRIALVWEAPVVLELNAQENGSERLVNPENPRTFEEVRKTGGGFLTTYRSFAGTGQNAQVFSFWHRTSGESSVVKLMIDFVSRSRDLLADTCGEGALAAPRYIVLRSERGLPQRPVLRRLAALQCAEVQSSTSDDRLISGAIADLIVAN